MSGRILIGTTSWTDKSLIASGRFYPPQVTSAADRLRYYASQFPIVEVDSSYYGLPSERNSVLWTRRTPVHFVFDVKAFRLFTLHRTPLHALPADLRRRAGVGEKANVYYRDLSEQVIGELWTRFRSAIAPLKRAGRLGVVLLQFAPWMVYRPSSLDHIADCARRLEGHRVAVELRNKSWLGERHREETLDALRRFGLAHVVVDGPQGFGSSVPPVWEVTTGDTAIVRLHGRNRENWEKKGLSAAERFAYLYSDEELKELAEPVGHLGERAGETHVLFNNCYRDFAQQNAARFRELLGH